MGDDPQPAPAPPPAPAVPAQPDPANAVKAAYESMVTYAPQFLEINKEQLPQYARLMTEIQAQQAPELARIYTDVQKVYGPQLVQLSLDQVKMADPTGFAIRQTMGEKVLEEMKLGRQMAPEEIRYAQQDIRAAQQARGVGTGLSDAAMETYMMNLNRQQAYQQRLANAGAFGANVPAQASFGSVNQAGQGALYQQANTGSGQEALAMPSATAIMGNATQQWGNLMNFTSSNYATQMSGYGQQLGYMSSQAGQQVNPFMVGLGVASQLGGAALMCWVAQVVYGEESPRWKMFREWLWHEAPDRFFKWYVGHGAHYAGTIRNNERIKSIWRRVMDKKIAEIYEEET